MVGGRRTPLARILTTLGVVVAVAAMLPAAGVSVVAKPFTAAFTAPTTFVPDVASSWEYTITDADNSSPPVPTGQVLGSAQITIPGGWNNVTASATGPTGTTKNWTASVSGGVINVDAVTQSDRLAGGETVHITINATPTCGAPSPSQWPVAVKQSNNFNGSGNDFILAGPVPQLTTSTTPGPLGSFTITTSPSPATAGQGFTVTATAYDTCNKLKTDYHPVGLRPTGTLSDSSIAPANDATGVHPVYGIFTWPQGNPGVGTATVVPKKADTGQTVTITDGAISKTSAAFNVQPGPLSPKFANQPGDTQVSQTIYSDVVTQTPVTVAVADAYGNPAPDGTNVTLSSTPAGLKGNGGTSGQTSGGVASFGTAANLNITTIGTYTLRASAGVGADTSTPFDVVTTLNICNNTNKCLAPASTSNGNQSADTTMTAGTGTFQSDVLESTFGAPPGGGCGNAPIPGTVASHVQVRQTANIQDTQPTFVITYTITKATLKAAKVDNLGAAQFHLCLGAKRLDGLTGGWVDASRHQIQSPDANGFYWGFVSNTQNGNNPFISSQHKDGAGNLIIVLVKPWPWDGWGYC
jgi:hypothetical protein